MAKTRRMRPALGTYVEVGIDGIGASSAFNAAFAAIADIDSLLSFHSPTSDLTRLNGHPGQRVRLHRTSLRVLRLAKAITRASGGAFNCTVGGALVSSGALPVHGNTDLIEIGDANDIEIGADWARLRRPVRITLDGIAKGYAVDVAIKALRTCGAHAGWVNAGGDLRVFGDIALPIQRREIDGQLTSLGSLRRGALASSRSAAAADERYASAIVGKAEAMAHVCSVLADTAWRADALTKVACCTAPGQRAALVAKLGGHLLAVAPERMAA